MPFAAEEGATAKVAYDPVGPTIERFHQARFPISNKYRFIRGPIGSGKTTACVMEIFYRMTTMRPDDQGVRNSRFVALRNTYSDLMTTTVESWYEVFPDGVYGKVLGGPPPHRPLDFMLEDGTRVKSEMIFLSVDSDEDVRKLQGLQVTMVWCNEVRHLPLSIVIQACGRAGRYPRQRRDEPYYNGLIGDTNAVEDTSWYCTREDNSPSGWEFFVQPPGLITEGGQYVENPDHENKANLEMGYYLSRASGAEQDWINVFILNQNGFCVEGKPIHPDYSEHIHTIDDALPDIKLPIYVGLDFGLTPAAVVLQQDAQGRWVAFYEITTEDMDTRAFAKNHLGPLLRGKLRDFEIGGISGDPAGDARAPTDSNTCFNILGEEGIEASAAPGNNDFLLRIEAVNGTLTRMISGVPGFRVCRRCRNLRYALAGKYMYEQVKQRGHEKKYKEKPVKNRFSHVAEALQYALLGAGEGTSPLRPKVKPLPKRFGMPPKRQDGQGYLLL